MPFLLLKSIIGKYFKIRVGHGVAWEIAPCITLIRAILGSIVRGQPRQLLLHCPTTNIPVGTCPTKQVIPECVLQILAWLGQSSSHPPGHPT